jgi:thousand and one amino acid protein kinase
VIQTTPKEEQKGVLKKLKEEERRKMALLGEQYEQTIAEMLQKQSVCYIDISPLDSRCLYQLVFTPGGTSVCLQRLPQPPVV